MSSVTDTASRPASVTTGQQGTRPPREQKYAPSTHLYYQGRLANIYLNWQGKTQLVVIPHQKCYKLTEFYPLDLGYLFQEIYSIMEQKRIMNFTLHVFKRDWDIAPHLFLKISMAQQVYNEFVSVPHISAGFVPPPHGQAQVGSSVRPQTSTRPPSPGASTSHTTSTEQDEASGGK